MPVTLGFGGGISESLAFAPERRASDEFARYCSSRKTASAEMAGIEPACGELSTTRSTKTSPVILFWATSWANQTQERTNALLPD